MSLKFRDRVMETTSSSGTADFTLSGKVVGFQRFNDTGNFVNGDTLYYCAFIGTQWEAGLGTYVSATNKITRPVAVASNSLGTTSPVNFTSAPQIICTYTAEAAQSIINATANKILLSTAGGLPIYSSSAISLAGDFATSGAYALTLTATASTNVTLPTTGTLATLAGSEAFTNKTINASLNALSNLTTSMFAASVVDTDPLLTAASTSRIPSQSAIKSYVDNIATGLSWKPSVACATTSAGGNIVLSGEQTIDGVLTSASRVLVKNQSDQTTNGIYVSSSGAWVRAPDDDAAAELLQATVFVRGGTLHADTQWTCTNDAITLGVTNITFAQVSGAGTYSVGTNLVLTGNQFSLATAVAITSIALGGAVIGGNALAVTGTALFGGQATFSAVVNVNSILNMGAAQVIQWSGRSAIASPSDGVIELSNNAQTDFTRLQFGGTTSSFPAISRNGTGFKFQLADASGYTTFETGGGSFHGASAASAPVTLWDGNIFTGGTGTTNFPHLFIQPNGTTAATTWSTAGTFFGINAASGFTGNYVDFRIAGGTAQFSIDKSGNVRTSTITLSSNRLVFTAGSSQSQAAWTTNGIQLAVGAYTWTDTTSAGTVAAQYVNAFKAPTVAASSIVTFTDSYNTYFETPIAGTNVTHTSAWALGADNIRVNGPISASGNLTANGITANSSTSSFIASQNTGTFQLRNGSTILSSPATATFQLGAADAAAPVAQIIGFQNVVAGTPNTNGVTTTIRNSASTGTGLGGNIAFQYSPHGSTGSAQNAWATALTINGDTGLVTFAGGTNFNGALTLNANVIVGASEIRASSSNILFRDSGATTFGLLQFGGTTSSFPALKRNTSNIEARLADDTGQTGILAAVFQTLSAGNFNWVGRSVIASPADGIIELLNNAQTDFTRLQFGGTTSSFPAIKRNGAAINFRLADDTADAPISAAAGIFSGTVKTLSTTVASLPAAATAGSGAHGFVTDATATMAAGHGATVTGGGANKVPVYSDGTNWIIG